MENQPNAIDDVGDGNDDESEVAMWESMRALRAAEKQRIPIWPPVLSHLTTYDEVHLVPLALRFHRVAMRKMAEHEFYRRHKWTDDSTNDALKKEESDANEDNGSISSLVSYPCDHVCEQNGQCRYAKRCSVVARFSEL